MSAVPGWYPDPAGRPGGYRYWDGKNWSAATTTNPAAAPPPTLAFGARGSTPAGRLPAEQQLVQPGAARRGPRRKNSAGWMVGGVAALVALTVIAVFIVRGLTGGPSTAPAVTTPVTGPDVCPTAAPQSPTHTVSNGPRVGSGKLSFPRLGQPFSAPEWDPRVPFGRDVQDQEATVEADPTGKPTWVAAVLIARLLAGDGFYGPEAGAKLVVRCIIGKFYGTSRSPGTTGGTRQRQSTVILPGLWNRISGSTSPE